METGRLSVKLYRGNPVKLPSSVALQHPNSYFYCYIQSASPKGSTESKAVHNTDWSACKLCMMSKELMQISPDQRGVILYISREGTEKWRVHRYTVGIPSHNHKCHSSHASKTRRNLTLICNLMALLTGHRTGFCTRSQQLISFSAIHNRLEGTPHIWGSTSSVSPIWASLSSDQTPRDLSPCCPKVPMLKDPFQAHQSFGKAGFKWRYPQQIALGNRPA